MLCFMNEKAEGGGIGLMVNIKNLIIGVAAIWCELHNFMTQTIGYIKKWHWSKGETVLPLKIVTKNIVCFFFFSSQATW